MSNLVTPEALSGLRQLCTSLRAELVGACVLEAGSLARLSSSHALVRVLLTVNKRGRETVLNHAVTSELLTPALEGHGVLTTSGTLWNGRTEGHGVLKPMMVHTDQGQQVRTEHYECNDCTQRCTQLNNDLLPRSLAAWHGGLVS